MDSDMSTVNIPAAQALAIERMGWRACGTAHWDHPARPMEQFDTTTALRMAREKFDVQCIKGTV